MTYNLEIYIFAISGFILTSPRAVECVSEAAALTGLPVQWRTKLNFCVGMQTGRKAVESLFLEKLSGEEFGSAALLAQHIVESNKDAFWLVPFVKIFLLF